MDYETVIGLETHVQLKTQSKMWCGCANTFGAAPNTQVCPVCLGMPGVLPVANEEALRLTALVGLLLNGEVPARAKFDRKNYFYPDAAKNYQITQFDLPSTQGGFVEFEHDGGLATVRITRAHLEEAKGVAERASVVLDIDCLGAGSTRLAGQLGVGSQVRTAESAVESGGERGGERGVESAVESTAESTAESQFCMRGEQLE